MQTVKTENQTVKTAVVEHYTETDGTAWVRTWKTTAPGVQQLVWITQAAADRAAALDPANVAAAVLAAQNGGAR